MALVLHGLLLRQPIELPPRGDFKTPAKLLTVVDDESGEVFSLMATDEAAAALADAQTPCQVSVELRGTQVDLASLTSGSRRGKAWRLRAVRAGIATERKR